MMPFLLYFGLWVGRVFGVAMMGTEDTSGCVDNGKGMGAALIILRISDCSSRLNFPNKLKKEILIDIEKRGELLLTPKAV